MPALASSFPLHFFLPAISLLLHQCEDGTSTQNIIFPSTDAAWFKFIVLNNEWMLFFLIHITLIRNYCGTVHCSWCEMYKYRGVHSLIFSCNWDHFDHLYCPIVTLLEVRGTNATCSWFHGVASFPRYTLGKVICWVAIHCVHEKWTGQQ